MKVIALLLILTLASFAQSTRTILVNTTDRTITVEDVPFDFGGTLHSITALADGCMEITIAGDLVLQAGDTVRGVGKFPAIFMVGNDVIVPAGATFDFSAIEGVAGAGGASGPGGGVPGTGGPGGTGGDPGKGGRRGTGGLSVSPAGAPIPLSITTPGIPAGSGSDGKAGGPGNPGDPGKGGNDGNPGFGNPRLAVGKGADPTGLGVTVVGGGGFGAGNAPADYAPPIFWGNGFIRGEFNDGFGEEGAFRVEFYDGREGGNAGPAPDQPAPDPVLQAFAFGNDGVGGQNLGAPWLLSGGSSGGSGSGGAGGPGGAGGGGGGGGGGGQGEWAEPLPTSGLDLGAAVLDKGLDELIKRIVKAYVRKKGLFVGLSLFKIPSYDIGAFGAKGGKGGHGSSGGRGASGGMGGPGGAGGGALMIHAQGRIILDGESAATGEDGYAGEPGEEAPDGTFTVRLGSAGGGRIPGFGMSTILAPFSAVAALIDGPASGRGGFGGRGGSNGQAGEGFPGGRGAGGAGGTIILKGSTISGSGEVVLLGGDHDHEETSLQGGAGRLFIANNIDPVGTDFATAVGNTGIIVTVGTGGATLPGPAAANPFVAGAPATPMITELPSGAEAFGVTGLRADLLEINGQTLVEQVPANAVIGAVRLDVGPEPFGEDYVGYDLVLVFNPRTSQLAETRFGCATQLLDGNGDPIPDPLLAGITDSLAPLHSAPVTLGGFSNDTEFGGTGDVETGLLGGFEVFAFLVPEDSAGQGLNFSMSAESGGLPFRLEIDKMNEGEVLFTDFNPDIDVYDVEWVGPSEGGPDGNWNEATHWVTLLNGTPQPARVPNNNAAEAYNVGINYLNAQVANDTLVTIDKLGIGDDNGLTIQDNKTLIIEKFSVRAEAGVIANQGTMLVDAAGNPTSLRFSGSGIVLSGAGALATSLDENNTISGIRSSDSLIHDAQHTINAVGKLGDNRLQLTNHGTINALAGTALSPLTLVIDPAGDSSQPAPGFLNTGTVRPAAVGSELRFEDGFIQNDVVGGIDFLRTGADNQTITFADARYVGAGDVLLADDRNLRVHLTGATSLENVDIDTDGGGIFIANNGVIDLEGVTVTVGNSLGFGSEMLTSPAGTVSHAVTFRDSTVRGARFAFDDPGDLPTCGTPQGEEENSAAFIARMDGTTGGFSDIQIDGAYCYHREDEIGAIFGPTFYNALAPPEDHVTLLVEAGDVVVSGNVVNNGLVQVDAPTSSAITLRVDGMLDLSGTGGWNFSDPVKRAEIFGANPGVVDQIMVGGEQTMRRPSFDSTGGLFVENHGDLFLANFDYDHSPLDTSAGSLDAALGALRGTPLLINTGVIEAGLLGGGTVENAGGVIAIDENGPAFENVAVRGGSIELHHAKSQWTPTDLDGFTHLPVRTFNTALRDLTIASPNAFDPTLDWEDMFTAHTSYGGSGLIEFEAVGLSRSSPSVTIGEFAHPLELTDVRVATHAVFPAAELSDSLTLEPGVVAVFDSVAVREGFDLVLDGVVEGQPFPGALVIPNGISGDSDTELLFPEELNVWLSGNIGDSEVVIINETYISAPPMQGPLGRESDMIFEVPGTATLPPGLINRGVISAHDELDFAPELVFLGGHVDNSEGVIESSGEVGAVVDNAYIAGGVFRSSTEDTLAPLTLRNGAHLNGVLLEDVELSDGGGGFILEDCVIQVAGAGYSDIWAEDIEVRGDLTFDSVPGADPIYLQVFPEVSDPTVDRVIVKENATLDLQLGSSVPVVSLRNEGSIYSTALDFRTPLLQSSQTLSLDTAVPDPDAAIGEVVTLAELGVPNELLVEGASLIQNSGYIGYDPIQQEGDLYFQEAIIDNTGGTFETIEATLVDTLIRNVDGEFIADFGIIYNGIIFGGQLWIGELLISDKDPNFVDSEGFGRESITTFQDLVLGNPEFAPNSVRNPEALVFCTGQVDGTAVEFTNGGEINVAGTTSVLTLGALINDGEVRLNSGTLKMVDELRDTPSSVIKGIGTVDVTGATMLGAGKIAPGFSAGQIDFIGDLALAPSSQLAIEIGGPIPGEDSDLVTESGTAPLVLNGALYLSLLDGFVPMPADTFTIITSNQPIEGAFGNRMSGSRVNVPGSGSFEIHYGVGSPFDPNSVVLTDFSTTPANAFIYVDGSATGGNDGSSWTDAYTELAAANNAAQPGDEVWVAAGTYKPTATADRNASLVLKDLVAIYGGFVGGEMMREERNPDALTNGTVISGDIGTVEAPARSVNVITSTRNPVGTILDGFEIRDGLADTGDQSRGAGLECIEGTEVTVANCHFTNNGAVIKGGAVAIDTSTPTFVDCTFTLNDGGYRGGGVWVYLSNASFRGCRFENNTATRGGGVLIDSGAPTMIDCAFVGNAGSTYGSGVSVEGPATPSFRSCRFEGNQSVLGGGAVELKGPGQPQDPAVTFTSCSFRGNSARNSSGLGGNGGAILAFQANFDLVNCLFSGNQAGAVGGAVYAYRTGGIETMMRAVNCTFGGNLAENDPRGGAIFLLRFNSEMTNCIVWGNRNSTAALTGNDSIDWNSRVPVFTNCLVEHVDLFFGTDNFDGTDPANDPLFEVPVDPLTAPVVGGNLRLLSGSPALDMGDGVANPEPLDLDGRAREFEDIDLGAYERQPLFLVDASAAGEGLGVSWNDAYPDLQSALAVADSESEIWVAAGTYVPTSGTNRTVSFAVPDGVTLLGGFASGATAVEQRDPAANATVLSGDIGTPGDASDNSLHVVTGDGLSFETVIDGFTITGGNAIGFDANHANKGGGMLLINGAEPTLRDLVFLDNTARGVSSSNPADRNAWGGGLAMISSTPTLEDCEFLGNRAIGADQNGVLRDGGAAYGGALHYRDGAPDLTRCLFRGNSVLGGTGSVGGDGQDGTPGAFIGPGQNGLQGIQGDPGASGGLALGGAIHGQDIDGTMVDCVFQENMATGGPGGSGGDGGRGGNGADGLNMPTGSGNNGQRGGHGGRGAIGGTGGTGGVARGGAIYLDESSSSMTGLRFLGNLAVAGRNGDGGTGGRGGTGGDGGNGANEFGFNGPGDGGDGGDAGNGGRGGASGAPSSAGGGAIFADAASPEMVNALFVGNVAEGAGTFGTAGTGGDPGGIGDGGNGGNAIFGSDGQDGDDGDDGRSGFDGFSNNSTPQRLGGAVFASISNLMLTNVSLVANEAANGGGGIRNDAGAPVLGNSILFGNVGGDQSGDAFGTDSGPNSLGVDPLVLRLPDSGDGDWVTTGDNDYGDLRLQPNSPARNAGVNGINVETTDLAGADRIQDGTIDLGAFEGSFTTFALSFPGLDPDADDNGNGRSNFYDYGAGGDPTAADGSGVPRLLFSGGMWNFSHTLRNTATDVVVGYERSTDLQTFVPMVAGVDYVPGVTNPLSDDRDEINLELMIDAGTEPKQFIRQRFEPVAP